MNPADLKPPKKGFTKSEREWIAKFLIPAVRTVYAKQGHGTNVSDDDDGQTINADDCAPCQ